MTPAENTKKARCTWAITKVFYVSLFIWTWSNASVAQQTGTNEDQIVDLHRLTDYIKYFNYIDEEPIQNMVSNEECWDWMLANVPWFECPDPEIEQMYYFRWWVFRKHIKQTPRGYVITEFLPDVAHSQKYNTIVCAAGLHIEEGRWLRNRAYLKDYINFWFSDEADPRQYSTWLAHAIYRYCETIGDFSICDSLFTKLIKNYYAWEQTNRHKSGLFWSDDDRDGGEFSISGNGLRPTLNSYLYADAVAISKLAERYRKPDIAKEFRDKANDLRDLVQTRLWDSEYQFFNTYHVQSIRDTVVDFQFSAVPESRHVREIYGYFPWKFSLPGRGFEIAWKELFNAGGFLAPYGPTTAERRHPLFMKNRIKRCQWDGSSWPFATSQTIGALINLIRNYDQTVVGKDDFFSLVKTYTSSQYRTLPYGEKIPWIGESIHPFSGIWLSRAIALEQKIPLVKSRPVSKDLNHLVLRGKDYNHSSYCDLIISGIVGLEIREDASITIDPLIPADAWNWFCLDGVEYQGNRITIIYDKDGDKYDQAPGLSVLVNGKRIGYSKKIATLKGDLSGLTVSEQ
jgi:hypothetical protein